MTSASSDRPSGDVPVSHRRIWAVSVPLILAGISETIIDVTDAIFLARVGVVELGAVALADAIYETAVFAVVGLVEGMQILIARRAGQARARDVGKVFNQGLYLLAVASAVLFVVIARAGPHLTGTIVESDDVRGAVDAFLRVMAYGPFFFGLNLAYSALLVGLWQTRALARATVILAATNIVLDYCLIFGHWGFPRLGIAGAAVASVVAEAATAVYLTGYVLRHVDTRGYGLFRFARWNAGLTRQLLRVSSPVMVSVLVDAGRWFVFFVIIEHVGEDALARSTIIYSFLTVFLIPVDGISETACSLVSNVIGRGQDRRIPALTRRALSLAYLATLPLALFALACPTWALAVFTTDGPTIDGCIASLRVISLGLLIVVPAQMLDGGLSGTGDTDVAFVIELLSAVLTIALVYAMALLLGLPLEFVWSAEIVGALVSLGMSYGWLASGRWRRVHV